ncbi:hypothetical protein ACHAXT_002278 [Thalassiosira profunda]
MDNPSDSAGGLPSHAAQDPSPATAKRKRGASSEGRLPSASWGQAMPEPPGPNAGDDEYMVVGPLQYRRKSTPPGDVASEWHAVGPAPACHPHSLSSARFEGGVGHDRKPPAMVSDSHQTGSSTANREGRSSGSSNHGHWVSLTKSTGESESSLNILHRLQSEAARNPHPRERHPPVAHGGRTYSYGGSASLGAEATKPLPMEAHVVASSDAAFYGRGSHAGSISAFEDTRSRHSVASMNWSASSKRAGDAVQAPRRDVIASIEADMMRLEAECEDVEEDRDSNSKVPPVKSNNPFEAMTDQISHMAIDPANDDGSVDSIKSWDSYDGKCTNIQATRAEIPAEEIACHALNTAVCDVYEAPVTKVLSQFPGVTRIIRANDDTGSVQLHYAVRHGNVEAIRQIVRADPRAALIRNFPGYCPLHTAVHVGNFASVQLLCSRVPDSAKVQCEEGCLPLHEAVSTAAHLPDAPQITAALINTFPSAVKITNDEGLLPLHLAAMSGFGAGIRTIFAYAFSTIYARENTEEMLPLDFAIDGYRTAVEEAQNGEGRGRYTPDFSVANDAASYRNCIVILLMSALYDRPVFTQMSDEQRGIFLPLHGAAAAQLCKQSWKEIVSMYGSNHASDVDVRGRTALHVLVSTTPYRLDLATEMIVDMNRLDAASATTLDGNGLIPLHAALTHRQPYAVVECLVRCNLSTIATEVGRDCGIVAYRRMLPFQLAAACDCGLDVVNLLLRAHPIGAAGALPTN